MTEFANVAMLVGCLATIVSIITQVTKELKFLKVIPTSLQVTGLSIVLTVLAYIAYTSYYTIAIEWYMIIGAVIGGFIVAFVSMFGWEKLYGIYNRYKKE